MTGLSLISHDKIDKELSCKYPRDGHFYAQRHLVECCFSKLEQFRRIATRFENTARNYLAVVIIAATILWIR